MAKQAGIFQTRGTIGNVTFKQTVNGFQLGMKSSLDKSKMDGNPRFDGTREANRDFTAAAKGAKLIIEAMKEATKLVNTAMTYPRLQRAARSVVNSDSVHRRGQKTMADGNQMLLLNFDFNDKAQLSNNMRIALAPSIDRVTGEFELVFPEFDPAKVLSFPETATHYQLVLCGANLNFVENTYGSVLSESGVLPLAVETASSVTLEATFTPGTLDPIFVGVGIRFFTEDGAFFNTMKGAAQNSFKIVSIDF